MHKNLKHKPYTIDAKTAHKTGLVTYGKGGVALVKTKNGDVKKVPSEHQFDLTQATIFGLNERLTTSSTSPIISKDGKTLRDQFNTEWIKYAKALENSKNSITDYGTYAFYEYKNELAKYCAKYWHRVVSVASNSKLISDPDGKLTWKEIRNIFEKTTISVAGCSVGNNIIHSVIMDMRPDNIKIADKSLYKMENINRVRLGYSDIAKPNSNRTNVEDTLLRNKAEVTALQVYSIDPYINIFLYEEGINKKNIDSFLLGRGKEPKTSIVVEEVDDPIVKILIRQKAREYKIPLIMVTDVGSSVQLDILRYDKYSNLPLTYGTNDRELLETMNAVYDNPGSNKFFFDFVDRLIGKDYKRGELKKIIESREEIPTSTIIPQLGSTAAMAGAIAAEAIARISLGHEYPARALINKVNFDVKIYN